MSENDLHPKDVAVCRRLHKEFGTTYFWASRFFPKTLRDATDVLYAFFRVPDEMVDNASSPAEAHERFTAWKQQFESGDTTHPVLRAYRAIQARHQIPKEEAVRFLDAMEQDLTATRYKTEQDLYRYMDGSAAAVGVMMSYVIGFEGGEETLKRARSLGYAMQLTNFLRDIDEDFSQRHRIYFPTEDLVRHGVTEEMLKNKQHNDALNALVVAWADRAREHYREADIGLPLLHTHGRLAVVLARRWYALILDELKARDFNPFGPRLRVSWEKKLRACFWFSDL